MGDSGKLLEVINKYIRPYTFPVAVKMAQKELDLSGFISPVKVLGNKIGVCQAIALVRRLGWNINYTEDDHACPGSYMLFGYNEIPEMVKNGGGLHYPVYSSTMEAGKKTHDCLAYLEEGHLHSMYFSPLHKAGFDPDIVLVYGQAAQIARFIQAVVYIDGGVIESQFMGRGACAASIISPYLTQKCNVVIPGGGERLFAVTDDTELIFSMPQNMFDVVSAGIEQTHKKGVAKIPTPFMGMMGEPQFPKPYEEVAKLFKRDFPIKC